MITEFVEIVGLLCHFRHEKGRKEVLDHQRFIEWLEYHRHDEIKRLIVNAAALRTEVDALLRSEYEQMVQKLNQIGEILVNLLSRIEEFRGLALAVAPNVELSEQAILILQQFVASGDNQFIYSDYGKGRFVFHSSNGVEFEVTEPRFIQDDLNQMVAIQLLTVEFNSAGEPLYGITRNAVRFIAAVEGKKSA